MSAPAAPVGRTGEGAADLDELAAILDGAAREARATRQPGADLTVADAYQVQARSVGLRLGRGERRIGYKLGFTSRANDFKFSLADVVADNCSAAGIVVGPWTGAAADVANLGLVLELNGAPPQGGRYPSGSPWSTDGSRKVSASHSVQRR
jgi:2-keto-4-pentenoate hydratase